MTENLCLIADDIEIHAGELRLVAGVSFELASGNALILRGANGIGKTSLLAVLAGLACPALGTIRLTRPASGEDFGVAENCHFLGHKLGLKTHQSVEQNLAFFARFYGEAPASMDRAASALSLMRLMELPVRLLSAGQKQRTAFARLLLAERPIWLLDEPTASLDADTANQIETICRDYVEHGGILIAATHLPFLEASGAATTMNMEDFVPAQRWVEIV